MTHSYIFHVITIQSQLVDLYLFLKDVGLNQIFANRPEKLPKRHEES